MRHVTDRDGIDQLDGILDDWLSRHAPPLHRFFRWYTDERLANLRPRAMWLGFLIMAIILIIIPLWVGAS